MNLYEGGGEPIRNKKCPYGGKTAFSSEHQAKQARNSLGKHTNVNELRVYKCPNCFQFHFTSRKD